MALACGALLIPASLMAYVLGFWRLASDMGMAREFAIKGTFSHWQLWMAAAVTLHVFSSILNRYGRGGALRLPRVLMPQFLSVHSGQDSDSPKTAGS